MTQLTKVVRVQKFIQVIRYGKLYLHIDNLAFCSKLSHIYLRWIGSTPRLVATVYESKSRVEVARPGVDES